jgi:hypothetical protein
LLLLEICKVVCFERDDSIFELGNVAISLFFALIKFEGGCPVSGDGWTKGPGGKGGAKEKARNLCRLEMAAIVCFE